jgi:predicted aldo/keto reductase-like oxidoreductase
MQYRINIKNGDKLSALGFGFMRLPKLSGKKEKIDRDESIRLARFAYEMGVNYFDTAYVYLGGESEKILGEAVKPFRDKIKIADKLPLYYVRQSADIEKFFRTSLERLQTTYIDYYLMHSMIDFNQWEKMKSLGILPWIKEKKEKKEIINAGFSFHGRYEDFIRIIDDYEWDFCQIQYNFLDINYQAGTEGLKYANSKGIPVIIMEPLRGGMITNSQPVGAVRMWEQAEPKRSLADWGLRWVWNHKEVTLLLSGMNAESQLLENVRISEDALPDKLSGKELSYYEAAREELDQTKAIRCTGCKYCMPCPQGVDIPTCFAVYNNKHTLKARKSRIKYISDLSVLSDKPGYASLCKKCGKCETHCPQGIKIRDELAKVRKDLEFPFYKTFIKIAKKIVYKK